MEVMTLREIAEKLDVSYESIRRQVVRYDKELSGHISRQGKTQYLDAEGFEFLKNRRRASPVIVKHDDRTEELKNLREEAESLKQKLIDAQNQMLAMQNRIISLQDEVKEGLEAKASYHLLLEEKTKAEEKIADMTEQVAEIRSERDAIKEEKDAQQAQIFSLQAESESQRATIDSLTQERDAAIEESQSYHKSWFGFYRKG